jgi:glycosyltransferase
LIERTLRSVLAQDLPGLEYVVIDGASTDGTLAVIDRYRDRVQRLVSEPDGGIAHAFNKGIAASSGRWLLMLNAGDALVGPHALRALLSRAREGVSILTARARLGTIVVPRWRIDDRQGLLMKAYVSHQATLVHRDVYRRHGGYDASFRIRMDFDFFLRVLQHERLTFVDEVLVDYLPGGLSGRDARLFWTEGVRALDKNRCGAWTRLQFEMLRLATRVLDAARPRAQASGESSGR